MPWAMELMRDGILPIHIAMPWGPAFSTKNRKKYYTIPRRAFSTSVSR